MMICAAILACVLAAVPAQGGTSADDLVLGIFLNGEARMSPDH